MILKRISQHQLNRTRLMNKENIYTILQTERPLMATLEDCVVIIGKNEYHNLLGGGIKPVNKMDFKKYVGIKELKATPMTKEEYCQYRGWEIPKNEEPGESGYLVEYLDGGKPNDERHEGYISWSPKDVFEKSYRENGSFLQRLRIEQDELNQKLGKLEEFMAGDNFKTIDEQQQNLLRSQSFHMSSYNKILVQRIALLNTAF